VIWVGPKIGLKNVRTNISKRGGKNIGKPPIFKKKWKFGETRVFPSKGFKNMLSKQLTLIGLIHKRDPNGAYQ